MQVSKAGSRVLLLGVLVVHVAMLGYSAFVHSPMTDEIAYFASGIGHWRYGDFELYNVNPPLARVIGTLPVHIAMPWNEDDLDKCFACIGSSTDAPGIPVSNRKEFLIGDRLIEKIATPYLFWFMIARWACIPFSCVGAWVCYAWAKDLYGTSAGYMALLLW